MNFINKTHEYLGSWVGSVVLLLMRLYWGFLFFQSGYGKLQNIENVAGFFDKLGIYYPVANAWIVGVTETVGGLCLLAGFLSPLVSLLLISVMSVAYVTAHWEGAIALFVNPELFMSQGPFMFLLTALLVFSFGPGKFSLDQLFWGKGKNE